jgi:hypothetical protein
MAKKNGSGGGWIATLVGAGVALHTLHEAVDGFEWAASLCPCRLRRRTL